MESKGFFFYEKQCPTGRPQSVKTAKVPKAGGGEVNYCVMNDLNGPRLGGEPGGP